jgi:hypothetical protein
MYLLPHVFPLALWLCLMPLPALLSAQSWRTLPVAVALIIHSQTSFCAQHLYPSIGFTLTCTRCRLNPSYRPYSLEPDGHDTFRIEPFHLFDPFRDILIRAGVCKLIIHPLSDTLILRAHPFSMRLYQKTCLKQQCIPCIFLNQFSEPQHFLIFLGEKTDSIKTAAHSLHLLFSVRATIAPGVWKVG